MTCLIGSKQKRFNKKSSFTPLENFKKVKGTSLTGFTLIELLVVVAIIGSLLALSLPRFRGTFSNLRFDNFCENLISRMRYLQERASFEQKFYLLDFDLPNKIIEIGVKDEISDKFAGAKGILGRKIIMPKDIEIEAVSSSMIFLPDGTIEGKDIKILGDQNKATIFVKESMGRVKLEKE